MQLKANFLDHHVPPEESIPYALSYISTYLQQFAKSLDEFVLVPVMI